MDRRRYRWPMTIGRTFYTDPVDPGRGTVIVQNAGASLHPGDHVTQRIEATAGARVDVVGQGAMLVTGVSGGRPAVEETSLVADASSTLVYIPEPRILTRSAHVEQNTQVELGAGAAVLLTDAVVVHPEVTAESFGSFRSRVTLTAAGYLRMFDAQSATSIPNPRSWLRAFATVYLLLGAGMELGSAFEEFDHFDGSMGAYAAGTVLPNNSGLAIRIAATGGDTLRAALGTSVQMLTNRVVRGIDVVSR